MKLFWQQQQKLFSSSAKCVRFHPMIIRFSLSLAAKSAFCYKELRNSGIVKLPSQRTLRDYYNFVKPKPGFNKLVIDELVGLTKWYSNTQRYIVLLFDNMKIGSNLVFDKNTGQLIGFTDLGDSITNYATFEKQDNLASHVLAFFIRGLTTNLKFSFSYFATKAVTAFKMLATNILGSSYFGKNMQFVGDCRSDVCYRTIKFIYKKQIYLFCKWPSTPCKNCM